MTIELSEIKKILATIMDPVSGKDIVAAGLVSAITLREGRVGFMLTINPAQKAHYEALREEAERRVKALAGVESVTAVMTAHHAEPIAAKPESGYVAPRERAQWNLTPIAGVAKVIAVASGKGGVGKSTTTLGLAYALQAAGKKVAILDADIYGPSIAHMLGVSGQPEIRENKMVPAQSHGISCMSMALISGAEAAILRGPMISKALHQMLRFTAWGELDALLVDMPPGTGDIHLSLCQQVPLGGAVIVTTPQKVATMDAAKCLQMFQKVNVPIMGVVENMSGSIFGEGGGKTLAEQYGVPYLGAVPMDKVLCEAMDKASPPAREALGHYDAIATGLRL